MFDTPVRELLPHAPPMVLLDKVLSGDVESLTAALTIRRDNPFFVRGQGVPAHIGIEWMAQACGAFAGANTRRAGGVIKLGFLLGTRRYQASCPWFREGEKVTITVRQVFLEEGMAIFDCLIESNSGGQASAQLTTYQPEDASAILARQSMGSAS